MSNKLYVVGGSIGYANWLVAAGYQITYNIDEADTLLFTGGSDISPSIYGHEELPCTWTNPARDKEEVDVFNRYVGEKSMAGVCRGHQLLSCLLGAKMIQDLSHPGSHLVDTIDGKTMRVNSLHHQAVYVPQELYDENSCHLFAWSNKISPHYQFADKSVVFPSDYKEVECLYWPEARALCTQNHPEIMDPDADYVKWLQSKLSLIK